VRAGRTPAFTLIGAVLALAVIGILVFTAGQGWVSAVHPIAAGSFSTVLGETVPCGTADFYIDDESTECYVAPFAEGHEVGIGFTVWNDAPIGMTILSAQVIRDGVLTPAALEPQLLRSEGYVFGLSEGVPFEPVEVPAGEEVGIQFVGAFGDCETAAENWSPGSGLIVGDAFMTVRWGVFTTEVQVPAPTALVLEAPMSCP